MSVLTIQTLSQRLALIRSRILANNSTGATPSSKVKGPTVSAGSQISNIFMVPQAVSDTQQNALAYLNDISYAIQDILAVENDQPTLNLLATALNITVDEVMSMLSGFLDRIGSNFNTPRQQPTYAVGQCLLGSPSAPTQDITVQAGTLLRNGAGTQYSTLASVTMAASQAASYFNSQLLMYVIPVDVQCTAIGSIGDTPENSIVAEVSSVSGLPYVSNLSAISGGRDLESDPDYGARLLTVFQALGAVTKGGVERTTGEIPGEVSMYIATATDPLAVRGPSKTDVWVQSQTPKQATESFSGYNHPKMAATILPSYRPVLSLVSVSSGTASLVSDTTSQLAGSCQSYDGFQFSSSPVFPVSITYSYDASVTGGQQLFNADANAPLNQLDPTDLTQAQAELIRRAYKTPILVKAGIPLGIDYSVNIQVTPGNIPAQVIQDVVAALEAFAAASQEFQLGSQAAGLEVYQDDLNKVVESTPGVSRITSVIKFSPTGQAGVLNFISANNNQYVVPQNLNIFAG